ncbi:two-component system sensor histidine kinase RegB [Rhizomicrobium palustre]|uniref:histidine kinase n=1 Tax=Rhizomicrobium palustre TaxID=189966 RepID=A0A846MZ46_9PROT|nr:ActS/PrrB/RegB family redox-sensitive histidine kinase [Rhizomicrobium palustre]NIK88230.1 two-component system sensor histidine kinase RegB [Rhizomicrobium palustre]
MSQSASSDIPEEESGGHSRGFSAPRPLPIAPASAIRGRVRLRTLTNLRWMATCGQTVALFLVYFGFQYDLPIWACLTCVVFSATLNIILALRYPPHHRLTNREATIYLAIDVLQLAALLYLTGGISNPFAMMFVAPVVIAASTLNLGNTMILGAISLAAASIIAVVHEPLPWAGELVLPALYQAGLWASLVLGIGFTSVYAWRIASEAARMSAGLAATQLALAREQRLSTIGALATAAAHELGSPLGTIAVVAHELERTLPAGSAEAQDARLLRAQAERCRMIIMKLARPDEPMLGGTARLPICALLDDMADQYRDEELEIVITAVPGDRDAPQPQVWRAPELLHGLGNIIENAADFARTRVRIEVSWDGQRLKVSVEDDGPGFAPDIIERIGEPYTTSRPSKSAPGAAEINPPAAKIGKQEGMGLGFFIAKTLLEQTGGTVKAINPPGGGARVSVSWPRGQIDGDKEPPRGEEE